MAIVGYARVSTAEQHLDLQLDALNQAGVTSIYEESASGKSASAADRPELAQCLKALRPGDVLAVWRLDRLGRSLTDLVKIVSDLESRGVAFRSLSEAIDTSGPAGKLVFHIFAALAQFERDLLRERTHAGLAAARARGRHGGRPRALSETQIKAALALMQQPDIQVKDICQQFSVSRSTLYGYLAATQK